VQAQVIEVKLPRHQSYISNYNINAQSTVIVVEVSFLLFVFAENCLVLKNQNEKNNINIKGGKNIYL